MKDDGEVGITDIYLNNYIIYTPNQETELVSLVSADTFRYKRIYLKMD